jgi:hypothetical protein
MDEVESIEDIEAQQKAVSAAVKKGKKELDPKNITI